MGVRGKDKRTKENINKMKKNLDALINQERLKYVIINNIIQPYIISSKGIIYSAKDMTKELKPLMPYMDKDGHLKVGLHIFTEKNNASRISKQYLIHRLVAMSFIPNPENKEQVHHIDGDPLNNDVNNLTWVTKKEHTQFTNDLHQYTGIQGSLNPSAKYTDNDIKKVIALLEENKLYLDEISQVTGVSMSVIQHLRNRNNSWNYLLEGHDISKYNKFRRCVYTPEQYNEVVKIFSDPYRPSIKKISEEMNLSYSMIKQWHRTLFNQGLIPKRIKQSQINNN